jgi:hypothetical protein
MTGPHPGAGTAVPRGAAVRDVAVVPRYGGAEAALSVS